MFYQVVQAHVHLELFCLRCYKEKIDRPTLLQLRVTVLETSIVLSTIQLADTRPTRYIIYVLGSKNIEKKVTRKKTVQY